MKIRTKARKMHNEEEWIGNLLDGVEEEKLLEMSAIHRDIPMPIPNQEKLARSVIDKAKVLDEEETERRREFTRAYRRKQLIHTVIAICIVCCVLVGLYFAGIFDRVVLPKYQYHTELALVQNGDPIKVSMTLDGETLSKSDGFTDEGLWDNAKNTTKKKLDQDKLENTAYAAAAKYCTDNDRKYAVDEYKILRCFVCQDRILCEVVFTFLKTTETGDVKGKLTPLTEKISSKEDSALSKDQKTPAVICALPSNNYMGTLVDQMSKDLETVIPSKELTEKQGSAVMLLTIE